MAAPIRFLSGRQQQQKIGIEGSTDNQKVLEVVGQVGIGTTVFEPSVQLEVRGDASVSGVLTTGSLNVIGDGGVPASLNVETLNATGVSTFGGVVDINNSTIADNSAVKDSMCQHEGNCEGGGIYTGLTANIKNSIIWGNWITFDGMEQPSSISGSASISYSDVNGVGGGTGNIEADPRFATGPLGDYYLSNFIAGQSYNSPCIDMGSNLASYFGLDQFTTSTDNFPEGATPVDMGYHYPMTEEPSLTLIEPNGGETLISGQNHTISWQSTGAVRYVKVEYSLNNGSSWSEVSPPSSGDSGSYLWNLPAVDSNQCLVRITDEFLPYATDTSDSTFTIFICHLQGDLDGNCYVNFDDFVIIANEWLECGIPFDPDCGY